MQSLTTGEVYDLDYIQTFNWCQVLTRNGSFKGVLRDVRLQQPLQAAMQRGVAATVHYYAGSPNRIYRVEVEAPQPEEPDGLHHVVKLDVDEETGKCEALFLEGGAAPVKGFTRDVRLESLLAVAMGQGWPIKELDIDAATYEIKRGKINL